MLPASFTRVCLALLATTSWMVVSSYLIILNRHIMVDLKFQYPMTLSGMGMVCSWILSVLCCKVFCLVETKASVSLSFWASRILPVGFFMAVTLWSGNEVYMYLSVSFIQMLKAFTPVITMVCLTVAGLETPTGPMISSVLFLSLGIALAAYGEVNMSVIGLIINTTSAVSESIRLVMTQWLLTGLKFHPIEGLLYLAPACMLWLYSGAAVVELPAMIRTSAWDIILAHPIKFGAAAALGFLVNILAFWSIKLASALTLKVLGTVKNTLIVVGSVMLLGEVVTALQGVGYAIAVLGFAWYTKIKTVQIAEQGAAKERAKLENEPIRPIVDSLGSITNLTQPLLTFKSSSGSLSDKV